MQQKFEGADGIRGLACLIVIVIHGVAIFFNPLAKYLAGTGKIGVWLFFVLSAFLLTSKFLRSGFSAKSLAGYALGRSLRIIPLFVIVVMVYYYANMLGLYSVEDLKNVLLFNQVAGHLWTIPVEFKFYFLLPFLAFFMVCLYDKFRFFGCLAGFVVLLCVQQWLWPFWMTPENSLETRWYLSSFTIGSFCTIAHLQLKEKITAVHATAVSILVIIMIVVSFPVPRYILFSMPIDSWLMNKFVVYSFLWAIFICVLADGKGIIGRILMSFVFRKVGAWSYSIYLIHILVYFMVAKIYPNNFVAMMSAMVMAIVAGLAIYYLIENPLENLRHKIQRRIYPA